MRRTLCVWFPHWPLQHLLANRPELRGKCVVLCDTEARHGTVQYVSRGAMQQGVFPGQVVAEAIALAEDLYLTTVHPAAEAQTLQQLADECLQFAPKVSLAFPPLEDSLLLDLTGCARLYPQELQLARKVLDYFEQDRWRVRLVVADTPTAAWAITRYKASKSISIVSKQNFRDTLAGLPIAALRLASKVEQHLKRLGLQTIGQVQALERASLRSRFGPMLLQRLDELYGTREESIKAWQSPPLIVVQEEFETGVTHSTAIQTAISQLVEKMIDALRSQQLGVLRLEGRLYLDQAPTLYWQTILLRPSLKARHLEELIWLELDQRSLVRPVVGIELAVLEAASLESRQQDLFEARSQKCEREWQRLVEKLIGRLGTAAVGHPVTQRNLLPEDACTEFTLDEPKSQPRLSLPQHRPIQLLAHPYRLEVTRLAQSTPPNQFWYQAACYQVAQWWGPERIQTGWWQGKIHSRDYFRIETEEGCQLWIFRDRQEDTWYLHGWFD